MKPPVRFVRIGILRFDKSQVDRVRRVFEEELVSAARGLDGNTGVALLISTDRDKGLMLAFWESRAAMEASTTAADGARSAAISAMGAELLEVAHWEVAVWEEC